MELFDEYVKPGIEARETTFEGTLASIDWYLSIRRTGNRSRPADHHSYSGHGRGREATYGSRRQGRGPLRVDYCVVKVERLMGRVLPLNVVRSNPMALAQHEHHVAPRLY